MQLCELNYDVNFFRYRFHLLRSSCIWIVMVAVFVVSPFYYYHWVWVGHLIFINWYSPKQRLIDVINLYARTHVPRFFWLCRCYWLAFNYTLETRWAFSVDIIRLIELKTRQPRSIIINHSLCSFISLCRSLCFIRCRSVFRLLFHCLLCYSPLEYLFFSLVVVVVGGHVVLCIFDDMQTSGCPTTLIQLSCNGNE